MALPIALFIDDSSPIHLGRWHQSQSPNTHQPTAVSNSFLSKFADLCDCHGVCGKFSVVPMPCNLGRLDQHILHLAPEQLNEFITIVHNRISTNFDICPELLTHLHAVDLSKPGEPVLPIRENEWIREASVDDMTRYLVRSLEILKNVGLKATGVTSPWDTGRYNESAYAEAIGRALWKVNRIKIGWYFLHCLEEGLSRWPWVTYTCERIGQTVLTIPTGAADYYWDGMLSKSRRCAKIKYSEATDRYLSPDGRSGRLRELHEQGVPLTILIHWQSLFDDGRGTGLVELESLLQRIETVFGNSVAWANCNSLAIQSLDRQSVVVEP